MTSEYRFEVEGSPALVIRAKPNPDPYKITCPVVDAVVESHGLHWNYHDCALTGMAIVDKPNEGYVELHLNGFQKIPALSGEKDLGDYDADAQSFIVIRYPRIHKYRQLATFVAKFIKEQVAGYSIEHGWSDIYFHEPVSLCHSHQVGQGDKGDSPDSLEKIELDVIDGTK